MDCRQYWQYSYRENLSPQFDTESHAMNVGTLYHQYMHVLYHTMELGYKSGDKFIEEFMTSRVMNDIKEDLTPENALIYRQVLPLVIQYITYQSPRIDKDIEIIAAEKEFFVDTNGVTLHGFIDLIYRDLKTGRIFIRDHKTSTQKNAWTDIASLRMEDQLLFYALAMGKELDEPVLSVEISFANTYPYTKPRPASDLFSRTRYTHNEETLANFEKNLFSIHHEMENGPIYRRFSKDCKGCRFFQLCSQEIKGQSVELIKKNYFVDKSVVQ